MFLEGRLLQHGVDSPLPSTGHSENSNNTAPQFSNDTVLDTEQCSPRTGTQTHCKWTDTQATDKGGYREIQTRTQRTKRTVGAAATSPPTAGGGNMLYLFISFL